MFDQPEYRNDSMNVLVIRHAIAEDQTTFKRSGLSDDLRPLTVEGRRKMRKAAEGLKRMMANIDLIATSPLIRAVETAHVIAKAFDKARVVELKDLAPGGKAEAIFTFLVQNRSQTIALVGHQPDLGQFICLSMGCKLEDRVSLKKGGVAHLVFEGPVASGAATLRVLLTPQLLRKLAKRH
ncbi:MAG: phosphohistidine phosphatase SixA [Phycisphaerae bacterium]|nr:MAG: phosphohistidine phosphatase SixA [Phycisphaerae bacterium]